RGDERGGGFREGRGTGRRRGFWPRRWLQLPRRTVRLRLTLVYGGLFLVLGAALLAITYLLVSRSLPAGPRIAGTSAPPPSGGKVIFQAETGGCRLTTSSAALPGSPAAPPGQLQQQAQRCLT